METIGNYFFRFLTLVEQSWNYLNSDVINKYDFKYKESVMNHLKNFEVKMKQYNPMTVIISSLLIFYLFFFILRIIRKTWRKISKYPLFILNLLDSKEKLTNIFARFLLLLPMTTSQMNKSKKDMMETFRDVFKTNRFKRMDFHEKGINENTILERFNTW